MDMMCKILILTVITAAIGYTTSTNINKILRLRRRNQFEVSALMIENANINNGKLGLSKALIIA